MTSTMLKDKLQREQRGASSGQTRKEPSKLSTNGKHNRSPYRHLPSATPTETLFVEGLSAEHGSAHGNCVKKVETHILEILARSARFSQCCAIGMKVGTPGFGVVGII